MDAAHWPEDVRVAVNLSPLQFRVGNLLSIVMDALKQSGCRRGGRAGNPKPCFWKRARGAGHVHALRALGVRISMDDFGTGYSSLSISELSVRQIKIDRRSCAIAPPMRAQAIVRSIIARRRAWRAITAKRRDRSRVELSRSEGATRTRLFVQRRAAQCRDRRVAGSATRGRCHPLRGGIGAGRLKAILPATLRVPGLFCAPTSSLPGACEWRPPFGERDRAEAGRLAEALPPRAADLPPRFEDTLFWQRRDRSRVSCRRRFPC